MGPIERQDFAGDVSLSGYMEVLSAALATANTLVGHPPSHESQKLRFIFEEAMKLSAAYSSLPQTKNDKHVTSEIFSLLGEKWPEIVRGQEQFNISALWNRFMTEFPMGEYARMASEILRKEGFLNGDILEFGAGVGNTSRLVTQYADQSRYVRTDLNIKLLKEHPYSEKIALYDFNREGRWKNLSCIFGVNALHCASDKTQTLRHFHQMLSPGGVVLFGEGNPSPLPGKPWALTYLCGFFDGWWNQGGFISREEWFHHLKEAGFSNVEFAKMSAGENDLGGVIWARR